MPKEPQKIMIGEWLPDMPEYENPGCNVATNVWPRTESSYGPVGGLSVYSSALAKRCQGAAAFLDNLGNVNIFAGDQKNLYTLAAGSVAWDEISKTTDGYHCPIDGQWNWLNFNNIIIAVNYGDAQQAYDLDGGMKFDTLAAAAPQAAYIASINGFAMVARTYDSGDGDQPQRVWWPAFNDPTNWPVPGTTAAAAVQSSFNTLSGNGGFITGLVSGVGNSDGVVFMEHAIFRIMYAGPPEVFDFPPAEGGRGCPAPNSIVQFGGRVFYLGEDGFYYFDGLNSIPIGANKFDKFFYGDVDQTYMNNVIGTVDPINKLILWLYPGDGNVAGLPNRVLCYSWVLGRATIWDMEAEWLARVLSIGYTLDELYTVLGYTLDNLPAPLDSRLWTGGALLLGAFDSDHKLNFLTGANLEALVDTTESQPMPGRIARVTNTRPIIDGGTPLVAVGKRNLMTSPVVYTTERAMNALGTCPVTTSGRYLRGRIRVPAGSIFRHLMGIEAEISGGSSR